jgi:serine/threonine protein kinase
MKFSLRSEQAAWAKCTAHETHGLAVDVAIKVLPEALANDTDRLRRFENEARTIAALSHPNILGIHDIGTYEGAPFLVSELLEGQTLREKVPAPPPSSLGLLRPCPCCGL